MIQIKKQFPPVKCKIEHGLFFIFYQDINALNKFISSFNKQFVNFLKFYLMCALSVNYCKVKRSLYTS